VADTKISALTAASVALVADEFAVNEAGTSKKLTLTQMITLLQASYGLPRVKRLGSQHSISSTTGTEVTDLSMTLEAGTYTVTYHLIVQSATTTVGPMLGVNFTGTAAVKTFAFMFADGSTALTAYTANMDDEGTKGLGVMSGMNTKAYSTTAPNLGTTIGVTTAASDIGCYILGTLIVTASGDLELWHSSETATATSVEIGSSLVVVRTA
jgi:hypothetical protein